MINLPICRNRSLQATIKCKISDLYLQKKMYFSLNFLFIALIIDLKIIFEIIVYEDYNTKNYMFIMSLLINQVLLSVLFHYVEFHLKKSSQLKKNLNIYLAILVIISENICILCFRILSENSIYRNHFTQIFWDSQVLTYFSLNFAKNTNLFQKIMIFIMINTIIIILFHCTLSEPKEIIISILNFFINLILFYFFHKDFLKFSQNSLQNETEKINELCDLFQGFVIFSKDTKDILYISSKFSSSLNKLKTMKCFNDINQSLHDFEEQKIMVDHASDQQSILNSLKRNTNSCSFIDTKFKTKTMILLNSSKASKTVRNRLKYKELKEILEANEENFELFFHKNVSSTYYVYNSSNEKKELQIKYLMFQNIPSYFITIDNLEKINILANLSKENEFQSRLLSSFSHEMRTPLNGSLPILEDVLENLKPCCESYLKDNIFTAIGSLKLLENTINDIIDYQALYSGEFYLNIQETNLKEVLESVIQLMKIQAEKKGLKFISNIDENIPQFIMSDSNRIKQLLINLLENAIKFTIKGYVEITAKTKMKIPELLFEIQIKDSGMGIGEEKMEKMEKILHEYEFEKTQFLESTGCSFGIILSQNLAMALGSDEYAGLNIQTKIDEGSSFSFHIVDRIDQRDLNDFVDARPSFLNERSPIENLTDQADQKILEMIFDKSINEITIENNKSEKNEKNLENLTSLHRKSLISPILKKLRENTYSKIKSDTLPLHEEWFFEDLPPETKTYASQKLKILNENFKDEKHFVNNKCFSPILDSKKVEFKEISGIEISNNVLTQTQGSMLECTCNKILVVDDCIFNINTMELLLKKEGFKCDCAFDGFEAIEKFTNKLILKTTSCGTKCQGYRLIFMDFQMPKKDGVQAARELNSLIKEYKLPEIPIICCTAFDSNSLVTLCFQAGMKEVIFKPIKHNVLKDNLKKWLK